MEMFQNSNESKKKTLILVIEDVIFRVSVFDAAINRSDWIVESRYLFYHRHPRKKEKDQVDRTVECKLLEPQLPVLCAGAHRANFPLWAALPGTDIFSTVSFSSALEAVQF
jgi:hypothetical protein